MDPDALVAFSLAGGVPVGPASRVAASTDVVLTSPPDGEVAREVHLGVDVFHADGIGAGQTPKLIHNQIAIGTRMVLLEAAGLAARRDVDWETFLDVVSSPASMAAPRVFEFLIPCVFDRDFEAGFSVARSREDVVAWEGSDEGVVGLDRDEYRPVLTRRIRRRRHAEQLSIGPWEGCAWSTKIETVRFLHRQSSVGAS